MDIDNLKTFLEVYKTRHFGRAADNLYLTSAAVSARIKQLESYLGVTLFIRSRGNVQLTSEGEKLLPHAETLIAQWTRTLQEISLPADQSSRLYIGSTSGLWNFTLQEKLIHIAREIPEVTLQAEAHADQELVKRLQERTLDLAVLYEPPAIPELNSVKVGQLKLVMASTEKGITPQRALSQGYIYVDWGEPFAVFHANRFGEAPPASVTVNLASIAVNYLGSIEGSAYLPSSYISEIPYLFAVKGVPTFNRPIYACYRAGHERQALIKQTLKLIEGISI
ncbi:MAG: LysR family transcriptional regulator [Pseudomonadales bacterium]|nr:LysR family transcriptional regulator [Pseudomonadales bacterium]